MVHQTLTNDRAAGNATGNIAKRAARNTRYIAQDIIELVNLQGRLLAADLQASQSRLKVSAALIVVGLIAFISSLPVALIATAEALRYWGLPTVGAYFAAAGIGLVIAVIAIPLAWNFLRRALGVFKRSATEFQRNLECFKEIIAPDDDGREHF